MGGDPLRRLHTSRDEQGGIPVITVLVLFVTLALLGLIGATTTLSVDSLTAVNRSTATTQGTELATSAANAFYSYVEENPNALATGTYTSFPYYGQWAAFSSSGQIETCQSPPGSPPGVAQPGQGCFELTAHYASANTAQGSAPDATQQVPQQAADVTVTAQTGCAGTLDSCTTTTITQVLRRKTFLDYLYFFNHNRIDTGILPSGTCSAQSSAPFCFPAWVTGDVVNGPLHTNGSTPLPICGTPTFKVAPEVTGPAPGYAASPGPGCSGSTLAQVTTDTPVLPLPTSDTSLESIAAAGGIAWQGQMQQHSQACSQQIYVAGVYNNFSYTCATMGQQVYCMGSYYMPAQGQYGTFYYDCASQANPGTCAYPFTGYTSPYYYYPYGARYYQATFYYQCPTTTQGKPQQGYAFQGNITVAMNDNTLTITAPNGHVHSGVPFPSTGVIYASGNISVSGTNSGRLTLAAGGNITVTSNLTYASPPAQSNGCTSSPPAATCNAVTGLEADGAIYLQYNQQPLTVDAAMLSLTHSVTITPALSFTSAKGLGGDTCPSGSTSGTFACPTLTINGAMATDYRGIFGAYDNLTGSLDQGWHKDFTYDTRLFHIEPPWFLSSTTGQWVRSAPVQGG